MDKDAFDLLTADEVAKLVGKSKERLRVFRRAGDGPKFVRIGRTVFYRQSAISEWLQSQEASSHAEEAQRRQRHDR